MTERRFAAAWGSDGSEPDLRALAGRIAQVLAALAEHARVGPWELRGPDRRRVPATAAALEQALGARRRTEQDERVGEISAFEVSCHVYGRFEPIADFHAVVGVRHGGPRETWLPNRMVATLQGSALGLDELGRGLRALVDTTRPLWAFADGGAGMFLGRSLDGEPQVGWITYLHQGYRRPRDLPAGTSVQRFGEGRIVALERLPEDVAERGALVAVLEKALARAGVLRPHAELFREPLTFDPDEVAAPRTAAKIEPAARSFEPERPLASTAHAPMRAALEATPFKKGAFQPAPSALEPATELGGTAPATPRPGGEKATPFEAPPLSVERYAALRAELDMWPAERLATLARHGLAGEPALAALNRAYEALFAKNPALHGRWAGLYVRHKGSLAPRR